jgi:chaperonin GroEL
MQVEVGERKDRVTDALNATKAAVDEGIVAGGGAALLHASRSLPALRESMTSLDQRVGVDIVARAVQMPAKTILRNAGHEGAVIVGKLLESENPNYGYDSSKDQYCNMVESGARRRLCGVAPVLRCVLCTCPLHFLWLDKLAWKPSLAYLANVSNQ